MNETAARPAVEIPADVLDNSPAYIRIQWRSTRTATRNEWESALKYAPTFRYTTYEWDDVDLNGTRIRLLRIVRHDGQTVDLFGTYFFTRVACAECEYRYAQVYQVVRNQDGTSEAVPRCGTHADMFRRMVSREPGTELFESEPLRIGQHD